MKKTLILLTIVVLGGFGLNSFTSEKSTYVNVVEEGLNPLWEGYTNWYKVTQDSPNTGDPTGFLDGKHKGTKAYREIFINSVGEATIQKSGDNVYPEGTVIVKAAFKNKAAWEANKKPQVTVMVKLAAGESPETSDWGYVMGAGGKVSTGTTKWAKFCSKCHVFAQAKDFVFMNADQLAAGK